MDILRKTKWTRLGPVSNAYSTFKDSGQRLKRLQKHKTISGQY